MFANHPAMAHRWAKETPGGLKNLPERASRDKTDSKNIRTALKRKMGEAQRSKGKRPPNLRSGSDHRSCSTCANFSANGSRCRLYAYGVAPDQVCDSWKPQKK